MPAITNGSGNAQQRASVRDRQHGCAPILVKAATLRGQLDDCCRDLGLQCRRISQTQAELGHIRTTWSASNTRQTDT